MKGPWVWLKERKPMSRRMQILVEDRAGDAAGQPSRVQMAPVAARELLPELAPAEPETGPAHEASAPETLRDLPPEEARLARIATYALNAIVVIFALPVGAVLLLLNVFRGEDLRVTSHALALTGAWLGFASTPQGAAFLANLL